MAEETIDKKRKVQEDEHDATGNDTLETKLTIFVNDLFVSRCLESSQILPITMF